LKSYNISDMVKGWFIGNFSPTVFGTDTFEVGLKTYKSGDVEQAHFHKIAIEITLVASGKVIMCNKEWVAGSIIVLSPGEVTDFIALEDTQTLVIKVPSIANDKYIV